MIISNFLPSQFLSTFLFESVTCICVYCTRVPHLLYTLSIQLYAAAHADTILCRICNKMINAASSLKSNLFMTNICTTKHLYRIQKPTNGLFCFLFSDPLGFKSSQQNLNIDTGARRFRRLIKRYCHNIFLQSYFSMCFQADLNTVSH